MNFYINQSIIIQYLKVGGVSNSSVLQIGSAGMIKPLSNLYNTGAYTKPAPEAEKPTELMTGLGTQPVTLVPLQPPS